MITLEINEDELMKLISEGEDLKKGGFSGSLFLYNGYLIKMDRSLYRPLKYNNLGYGEAFKTVFIYTKTRQLAREEQIRYLADKQKDVSLTEFDLGVIKVNNTVCGVILPNHLDYQNLGDFEIKNLEDLLKLYQLLTKLLKIIKELEDNNICQADLINEIDQKMNILYKENDVKLCDLEGAMLKYGENSYPYLMYIEFSKVLMYFLNKIKNVYKEVSFLIEKLKSEQIVNYDMAVEFIRMLGDFLSTFNFKIEGLADDSFRDEFKKY